MNIKFYVNRVGSMPHEFNPRVPELYFYIHNADNTDYAYDFLPEYMVADLNTGNLTIRRTAHWVESIPTLIKFMQFVYDEVNNLKKEIKESGYSLPYNEESE